VKDPCISKQLALIQIRFGSEQIERGLIELAAAVFIYRLNKN
jgi:hypothetical protein